MENWLSVPGKIFQFEKKNNASFKKSEKSVEDPADPAILVNLVKFRKAVMVVVDHYLVTSDHW